MSTANLDERNLALQPDLSLINEDVMNEIYSVSPEDKPLTDSIGSMTSKNHYKEWVEEVLEAADKDNARIDGSESTGDDTVIGNRFGNYHQLATKKVKVSDRGRNSDTIGSSDELVRQLMRRQKALRRDVEASLTSNNVAAAGTVDGSNHATGASTCAGIGSWIITNNVAPGDFVAPVLSGTTGGFPTTAAVAGTKAAGSEANLREGIRLAYMEGGDVTLAMSRPEVIESLSSYLFTSSARVAALRTDASSSNRTNAATGGGVSDGGIVAQGSVNLFVGDFATVELVPNRFQPEVAAGVADLYLVDTDYWDVGYLQGYETKELARTGLADNREISVDFTLCAMSERSSAAVRTIDTALDWTA